MGRGGIGDGRPSPPPPLSGSLLVRLCLVGFFVNCQPSEPFLTRYLIEEKGLTEAQLDNEVWPVDTYAMLLFLLPMGLFAELWSYRGVIVGGVLCRQVTRVLLLFGEGLRAMQVMQAYASSKKLLHQALIRTGPPSCNGSPY